MNLAQAAQAADGSDALTRRRRTKDQWKPHRSLKWTLDAITAGPAFVRNGRMDVLAANPLFRAFCTDLYARTGTQQNLARFAFLDPAARRPGHRTVGNRLTRRGAEPPWVRRPSGQLFSLVTEPADRLPRAPSAGPIAGPGPVSR